MARKQITEAERERRIAARKAQAEDLQAGLAAQVEAMASGEQWLAYLDHAAKFHNYSFQNSLLILMQHPTATRAAGYKQWQERGRQVRKGEKAIRIYGFAKKVVGEDEQTGEKIRKAYFPILSIFAEDQTDPIIELTEATLKANPKAKLWVDAEHPAQRLEGEDPMGIAATIEAFATRRGWSFAYEPIPGETNGFASIDGTKQIVVDVNLSDAMKAKTATHELAHSLLHAEGEGRDLPRNVQELEAESVAYVVAGALGLDTAEYSIGYLCGWSKGDGDKVRATAERVMGAAKVILDLFEVGASEEAEAA